MREALKYSRRGQMSESWIVGIFLSLSGGFQDAYTYHARDGVFANAQTGNIVLAGQNFATGHWMTALRYAVPILAFVGGICLAQEVRRHFQSLRVIHWRQIILILEIAILFAVGMLPTECNIAANVLASFSCAMQVDSFRKVRGNAYATTMCIGNLRSATDLLCAWRANKDRALLQKSIQYYLFILIFAVGAVLGGVMTSLLGLKAVWLCCAGILVSFLAMFIREETQDHNPEKPSGSKDDDIENKETDG